MLHLRSCPKHIGRAPIDDIKKYVPQQVLEKGKDSLYYKRGSDAVVTTSERTTSTKTNREDCAKKLHDIIRVAANDIITEAARKPPKQL